jgi:WD40 repeat protein
MKMILSKYNDYSFIEILMVCVFIITGCTTPGITLVTPVTTITKTLPDILIAISPISTSTQNTVSLSAVADATLITSTVTSVPTTIAVTPSVTPSSIGTITPYHIDTLDFKPISPLDPNWSSIIQRVDELQGFYTLALSPDGKLLAAIESNDNFSTVYLWDVTTGETKWTVDSDKRIATTKLIFSPDGTLLAAGTDGQVQNVLIWDAENGSQLHKFSYQEYTTDMNFSLDNKLLAISGISAEAIVFNLDDESTTHLGLGNGVEFMTNSPIPLLAVAQGWELQNGTSPVYLLNWQNGERSYLFPGSFYADGVAFSLDGQLLATVIFNEEGQSRLRILNLQNNEEILVEEHELDATQTRQIAFSSQGHLALLQGALTIWNTHGQQLGSLNGLNIRAFIFTPDGLFLLTYSGFDTSLEVWELPPP